MRDIAVQNPDKVPKILAHIKETLIPLLSKGTTTHDMVHRVLLEYLEFCSKEEAKEVFEMIKEQLPTM